MKSLTKLLATGAAACALALALTGIGDAAAQNKKGEQNPQRVKTYDFSGDEIDGDLVKPDGEFIDTRKFATHTSLIRIRQDFIREIVKSAEDI